MKKSSILSAHIETNTERGVISFAWSKIFELF
jgi:hypothetical protein